jgi:hypothetical protein
MPAQGATSGLRIAANLLRTACILLLIAVTLTVSMPQNETIWTVYDTTGDLIRLILGFVVSVGLAFQLFRGPADSHAYRTWVYLGIAAIPVLLVCLLAAW